eukprot:TRINITY_DN1248_c0_g5_i1.p4 TRINITY_DN1248_c0_g5~~TRINITY_DN1248_c0_g5_i1.p4  ORF type:complete len:151 (+),score=10.33 TRINITY_DN1248_c0_g5_i1:669-1121(+)
MDDVNEVLRYYAHQRFVGGAGGVTQPCQIRYIEYFHKLIKKQVKSAPPKMFRQMVVNYFPGSGSDITDCNVTAELYQYHFENLVLSVRGVDIYGQGQSEAVRVECVLHVHPGQALSQYLHCALRRYLRQDQEEWQSALSLLLQHRLHRSQ